MQYEKLKYIIVYKIQYENNIIIKTIEFNLNNQNESII